MNHDDPLTDLHAITADGLDGLLDVEAGLREVLVAAQHTRTGQDLDLDVETGLRTIVPATDPLTPADRPGATPGRSPLRSAVAIRLMSADIPGRLALRSHPAIVALALFLEITNAAATSQALVQALDSNSDRDSALSIARDLDHALDRSRACSRDLALDSDSNRTLGQNLDRALNSDPGLTLDLADAYDLEENLRRLGVLNGHSTPIAVGHSHRDRAVSLRRVLVHTGTVALGLTRTRAGALGRTLFHILESDLARAVDHAPVLIRDLDMARHDFTGVDFSGVELGRVSLAGIRWSTVTTTWPSEEWRAQALLDSRDLGDGTYQIEGGTTNLPLHST